MSEQNEMNRETGLMFALRNESIKNGTPLSGRHIFVDLDRGSYLSVNLNDSSELTSELSDAVFWQGEEILPVFQNKIIEITDVNDVNNDDVRSILMNGQVMEKCSEKSLRAETSGKYETIVLSINGRDVTYRQIIDALTAMNDTLAPLMNQIISLLEDDPVNGSLVFYGVTADFAPLQFFIRRMIRNDGLYEVALGEDRLFRFIGDNEKIIQVGMKIQQNLVQLSKRDKSLPFDIIIRLISIQKDGKKETREVILGHKGLEKEKLAPNMISFYAAPEANLHFIVDGKEISCTIPKGYLQKSCMVYAGLDLSEGKINIVLQKDDEKEAFTILNL